METAEQGGPARARAAERYSVSPPDEHGNRFITVLGDDGAPPAPKATSAFDREGA